jgi:hypothetical protein
VNGESYIHEVCEKLFEDDYYKDYNINILNINNDIYYVSIVWITD